jgi:hypothetical protein
VGVAALAVALLSPVPVAAAGMGAINPWALQNENPNANTTQISQSQAVKDALTFNFITAHSIAYSCSVPPPPGGCLPSRVPAMKKANPKLKIMLYMNATFAQSYQPPGAAGGFDPTWYEKDAGGNYVRNPKSGNYLMDPTNPGWIQHDADWCKQQLAGYDGCYLDALGLAPLANGYLSAVPINSATHQAWTKVDWIKATAQLAAQVRTKVQPLLVFGNGLTNGSLFYEAGDPTRPIIDGLDGGIAEEWLRQSTAPASVYPTLAVWKKNVNMIGVVESEGKPLLVVTKLWSSATVTQQYAWLQYSLATFLLGTLGKSAFFFSPSSHASRTGTFSVYSTNIGTPIGKYALSQGVYQRSFSNGLVLVNPSRSAVAVSLGRSYYTTTRQQVTSLTMAPNTGALLTLN